MCGNNPWQEAQNILCVRLDSMGDVLMTAPAIRALKAPSSGGPGRRITLLTSQAGAAVAALVPEIDEVIVYDAPWLKSPPVPRLAAAVVAQAPGSTEAGASAFSPVPEAQPTRRGPEQERAIIERLDACQFDAAVIFTVYSQNPLPSAFLTYMAGIPLRLAHCRENPYQLLTDWVPESEPDRHIRHEVQRQLDLVATVGCQATDTRMALSLPASAQRRVTQLLAERGLGAAGSQPLGNGRTRKGRRTPQATKPWVLIHPGATAQSRRYPPENYGLAARRLSLEYGLPVVFAGGDAERELVQDIQAVMRSPSHSLAGCLDLAETAALIAHAPVLVANNSGPAHLAAAVGTPVVDIYALTNPQHTPWQVPNRVLSFDVPCKWCYKSVCPQGHHDCLRRVEPDEVVQATIDLLKETGRL